MTAPGYTEHAEFPSKIPHQAADIIPYATAVDGHITGWQLSPAAAPHLLLTGAAHCGLPATERVVAIEAARQGHDVRIIDPNREFRGLRGWPNVTEVAARIPDMIRVVDGLYGEMLHRGELIEAGQTRASDFRRIVAIIDEYPKFTVLARNHCTESGARGQGKSPPAIGKLTGILAMSRFCRVNILLAGPRVHNAVPPSMRDNLGARAALGRLTRETAMVMFGNPNAGQDIPAAAAGVGTVLEPGGLVRATAHWLPDPADWDNQEQPLTAGDRQLLLDMLPPGVSWDGPAPEATQPARPRLPGQRAADPTI